MLAAKEQQYLALRKVLKEEIQRKRMDGGSSCQSLDKPDKDSLKHSKPKTVNYEHIQRLRETRDYSFLLFNDPVAMPVVPKPREMIAPASKANPRLASLAASRKQLADCTKVMSLKTSDTTNKTNMPRSRKDQLQERKLMTPKQSVGSSKVDQITIPGVKQVNLTRVQPAKKRPSASKLCPEDDYDYETDKALSMIRKMFNTQRFVGRDDSDKVVESSYKEIEKEDRRSTRFASEEDRQQLRLIQEEERLERMIKKAKNDK